MGQSKLYIGKACAYCRAPGSSTTGDHVIARAFFLEEDRADLPKVPACAPCNSRKSALENYVATTLLIGSRHVEGDRYRQELVRPRLEKNSRLRRETGLGTQPKWVRAGALYTLAHPVKVEADKINELLAMIVMGLFHHHFGEPLSEDFEPDISMFHPEHEGALLASLSPMFPAGLTRVASNLGRGSFAYDGARSPINPALSVWQLSLHGGIPLHGENSPPEGVNRWWGITRPTQAAIEAARARQR